MRCEEKETLLEKYEKSVRAYSEAVRLLFDGASLPLAEFEVVYNVAVEANEASQVACQAFLRHGEEHGCIIWPAA
jgi:hypothetical protein